MSSPSPEPGAFGIESLRRFLEKQFGDIDHRLRSIDGKVGKLMATLQDLDQALTDFEAAQDSANAEVLAAVNDILAKVGPAVDVSAEVARIKAAQQKQSDAADAINALDVKPAP